MWSMIPELTRRTGQSLIKPVSGCHFPLPNTPPHSAPRHPYPHHHPHPRNHAPTPTTHPPTGGSVADGGEAVLPSPNIPGLSRGATVPDPKCRVGPFRGHTVEPQRRVPQWGFDGGRRRLKSNALHQFNEFKANRQESKEFNEFNQFSAIPLRKNEFNESNRKNVSDHSRKRLVSTDQKRICLTPQKIVSPLRKDVFYPSPFEQMSGRPSRKKSQNKRCERVARCLNTCVCHVQCLLASATWEIQKASFVTQGLT